MLDHETIERAFELLNDDLARQGERAEIYIVGGAAMCLVHRARLATKDVDGWFSNPTSVRRAAGRVAEELQLPADWLNDAAKAFIPPGAGKDAYRAYSNLSVSTADAKTLFAMKCAAARTEEDSNDIQFLAKVLGVTSAAQALLLVTEFFPEEQLPVRSRLLLEELFS
jgi:hypothetical protein